jgi:hypothetical protein
MEKGHGARCGQEGNEEPPLREECLGARHPRHVKADGRINP